MLEVVKHVGKNNITIYYVYNGPEFIEVEIWGKSRWVYPGPHLSAVY